MMHHLSAMFGDLKMPALLTARFAVNLLAKCNLNRSADSVLPFLTTTVGST
jgi:hypothetical protein